MGILKLRPACKDYLWGGHRLVDEYGIKYEGDVCAEAWSLSCHPDGQSIIENTSRSGMTLREYIETEGWEVLGRNCRGFRKFPVLVKLIDAKRFLSIQVHPGDAYALEHEGQYGKSEFWYVVEAVEGAFLYYGFRKEISKEEFEERIRNQTLTEVLNAVPVRKGDTFFIAPGTIHAIGEGILVAEIQRSSNVTYRVYDYGRTGVDGKPRTLHIERALDVTDRKPPRINRRDDAHLMACEHFIVDRLELETGAEGTAGEDSFLHFQLLSGGGEISCGGERLPYRKGDSFFLPAGSGPWKLEGTGEALLTRMPEPEGKETADSGCMDLRTPQAFCTGSDAG